MILLCYHCGNETPHAVKLEHQANQLFEIDKTVEPEERYYAPFHYRVATCGTCGGVNLCGGFLMYLEDYEDRGLPWPRLYPVGPEILPPAHTLDSDLPTVPGEAVRIYQKAWPLRHTNPPAFANQVRRVLEVIADDQNALGRTLAQRLKSLVDRGVLPRGLAETADLIREVGNRGSHPTSDELDIYDVELLDELLKLIIHSVYLGPSHRARLRRRLSFKPPGRPKGR